jgi:N-acetyl-anhydromuramoyl-L-alanine amidase
VNGWHWDDAGWLSAARRVDSPNFDARPSGSVPEMVVIHNISLPPGEFGGNDIECLFTNTLDCSQRDDYAGLEALRVAAHFLIRRDGEIVQFVACDHRAWHAGVSRWQGRERCNDFSIGIELEGSDHVPFGDAQYQNLTALLTIIAARYPLRYLVGHNDIAPQRKSDPGPYFDWHRLLQALPLAMRNLNDQTASIRHPVL